MTDTDHHEGLTIDALAHTSGLPSSTIRLYQTKGLLAPPRRVGRTAHYGPDHVRRLDVIGRLQERGFSLAAIKAILDAWRVGDDLADLIGSETGAGDGPVTLSPDDVTRFFPHGIAGEDVGAAIRLGLVTIDGSDVIAPSRRLYELGGRMVDLGIPTSVILDEFEHLQGVTHDLARRFADRFADHVLPAADDLPNATRAAAELTTTVTKLVGEVLATALEAEGERRIGEGPPGAG